MEARYSPRSFTQLGRRTVFFDVRAELLYILDMRLTLCECLCFWLFIWIAIGDSDGN